MSKEQTDASGSDKVTSGTEKETEANAANYPKDFVEKLKKEKENLKKALDEIQSKIKSQDEDKLKEKEEFKKLAELKAKEAEQYKAEKLDLESKFKQGKINSAVKSELEKLGLDSAFTDDAFKLLGEQISKSVVIDSDTDSIVGAEEVAKNFYQKYAQLGFFKKSTASVNHSAAKTVANVKTDLSKMKTNEIVELWKSKLKQS